MNKLCYLAVAGLLSSAPACIISSDDGDPSQDDPRDRDQPAESTAACLVDDQGYAAGEIDPYTNGQAFVGETDQRESYMFAETTVEVDGDTHLISVDVWEDYGAFEATGWEAGTYTLAGDDTDFDVCGCCVYILEDYDAATNTYERLLMADGGEVEITDIDPNTETGGLDGHITDATFREVNEDADGYYDVEQGCTTGIADYTFDTEVAPVSDYPG